jgi:NIMA (never in mitosis gene a)-related kinase
VIKKIKFENLKVDKYKSVLEEVRNMRKVEHINIIKYYNSFFDEKAMYILMEFACGGDLHQFIKK